MAENGSKQHDRLTALIQAETTLMEMYESLDEGRSALESFGKAICVEKCGKCCEQTVPIASEIEISEIISTIGANVKFRKIVTRALEWLEHQHVSVDSVVKDTKHLQGEVFKLMRTQCPFLEPDKTCAIYEARPLMCRSYGVTVPADDFCPAPAYNKRWSRPGYLIVGNSEIGQEITDLRQELMSFISAKLPDQVANGFLPTMLVRRMAFKQFNYLVNHHKVQQPKLTLGNGLAQLIYAAAGVEDTIATEEKRERAERRPRAVLTGEYDPVTPSTPRFQLRNH